MKDIGVFYFLGVITAVIALTLFFSIRGCVSGELSHVKHGHYGYDCCIVEGSSAREAHIWNNGDGRIVVTPSEGEPFSMILTGKSKQQ